MSASSQTETHVAKKKHLCSWCGTRIEIGETYKRYRWFAYGEAGTVKEHLECYEAMHRVSKEEGGWVEFMPGDYRRGCSCGENAEYCKCKTI